MDESIKYWFNGFEKGLKNIDNEGKEKLFKECGKNCVQGHTLNVYKNLYKQSKEDIKLFIEGANKLEGVRTEIIGPGIRYYFIFEKCVCKMHNEGYINSPHLCECSRQSILYILKSIFPNKDISVKRCSTVLEGAEECRHLIEIKDKK